MSYFLLSKNTGLSRIRKPILGCVVLTSMLFFRSHMSLTEEERARYSRHLKIPGIDEDVQLRLKKGSILVIGLGGLGSPASLYLAAAGVGKIGLAEFDRVESHNLQRQILYTEEGIGKKKIDLAKRRLQEMNGSAEIVLHDQGIDPKNVRDIFSQYDVILDGSDNFDTRYLVNDACFLEKKPLVYGSVFQFEGQVMVLNDSSEAPCYRCLFPEPPAPGTVPNCSEAGVMGAICGVIGSLQAMEALKLLGKFGSVKSGILLKVDVFNNQLSKIALKKNPKCPLCGEEPRIIDLGTENYSVPCSLPVIESNLKVMNIEISVEQAKQVIDQENGCLLDVREPDEWEICEIKGAVRIPMGSVADRINELPKERPLIVQCHHGMRSLRVVNYLRSMGFENASSMKGGIAAWADSFDPLMARY